MAQRGITEKMISAALRKGTKFFDMKNKSVIHVLRGGFSSGKNLLVGRNPLTNKITTVMRNSRFNSKVKLPDGTLRYNPID